MLESDLKCFTRKVSLKMFQYRSEVGEGTSLKKALIICKKINIGLDPMMCGNIDQETNP